MQKARFEIFVFYSPLSYQCFSSGAIYIHSNIFALWRLWLIPLFHEIGISGNAMELVQPCVNVKSNLFENDSAPLSPDAHLVSFKPKSARQTNGLTIADLEQLGKLRHEVNLTY